jgi:hypothetical protein
MKPILFSTPMVKALLNTKPDVWPPEPVDGEKPFKWQTRRVIKRMKGFGLITEFGESDTFGYKWHFRDKHLRWHDVKELKTPFDTGDILYVRETFTKVCEGNYNYGDYIYRADSIFDSCGKGDISWAWTPSIYLPRAVARLFLKVKNVRVEKLRDITPEDKKAEGLSTCCRAYPCTERNECDDDPPCFMKTWDKLNAKRGYSWAENPWVWVIEFARISKPEEVKA